MKVVCAHQLLQINNEKLRADLRGVSKKARSSHAEIMAKVSC